MAKPQWDYIDHLRVLLTILVILHHTSITYGGEGSWYYTEATGDGLTPTTAILSLFTGINQAYFMGFFFLISGYFTPGSYERKGVVKFLKERFIRLGIPLLVYIFVIGPALIYALEPAGKESFWSFYANQILTLRLVNWGPLWFAEALLYMAVAYALARSLDSRGVVPDKREEPFPVHRSILLSAFFVGSASFLVRLVMPVGEEILGMQLGYFVSYIFLFAFGIAAYRRNWFQQLPAQTAKRWLRVSLCTIPILPVSVVLGDIIGPPGAMINGGFSWLAIMYAFWEPFVAFGIIMSLICWFRDRFNTTNPWLKRMADTAFTVYIIHPPVVVGVSYMMRGLAFPGLLKFIIAGTAAAALCFVIAALIRKLSLAVRVL